MKNDATDSRGDRSKPQKKEGPRGPNSWQRHAYKLDTPRNTVPPDKTVKAFWKAQGLVGRQDTTPQKLQESQEFPTNWLVERRKEFFRRDYPNHQAQQNDQEMLTYTLLEWYGPPHKSHDQSEVGQGMHANTYQRYWDIHQFLERRARERLSELQSTSTIAQNMMSRPAGVDANGRLITQGEQAVAKAVENWQKQYPAKEWYVQNGWLQRIEKPEPEYRPPTWLRPSVPSPPEIRPPSVPWPRFPRDGEGPSS